jgi:hypothetical protein
MRIPVWPWREAIPGAELYSHGTEITGKAETSYWGWSSARGFPGAGAQQKSSLADFLCPFEREKT